MMTAGNTGKNDLPYFSSHRGQTREKQHRRIPADGEKLDSPTPR